MERDEDLNRAIQQCKYNSDGILHGLLHHWETSKRANSAENRKAKPKLHEYMRTANKENSHSSGLRRVDTIARSALKVMLHGKKKHVKYD